MATITLRSVKGSPLTNAEVDANFSNINDELATKLSGTGGITVPSVTLSGSGGEPGVATLTWNDTAGTLDLGLKGGNVTMQIGEELFLRVTNSTGSAIPKGSVVYITGSTGNHVNVVLSQANSEGTSSKTLGITAEAIANAQTGFVATNGIVSGLDTSALTEGGAVWLSATVAGGLTSTRPSPPNHAVLIGWCVKSHASVGALYVHIANGYEVAELHDVLLTSIANNQVLSYESASGLWKNRSLATVANTGAFSDILSKPTTLSGYGITDAPTVTGTGASGTWGISITGNAATATRLINLRTINGVGFDGTADITIADSTKLPLSGGTLTGLLTMSGFANPHFTVTTSGGDYSYIRLWDGSSSGYLIKNVSSGTGNGMLAGSLYLYTDQNKPVQIVHAGTSNAAFLSGGDVYVRGQIYAAGNGASTGSQVLHAGNYSSYALPLSGGTISGTVSINGGGSQPLNLTTSSSSPWGFGLTRSDANVSSRVFLHNGSGSWTWVYEHNPVFYNGGAYNPFLHSGNYSSYALPLSGGTLTGTLYFTDTTNGLYKGGDRLSVRSESTDNVANFASYGLYLPQTGQTAGLYVESPIEARGGLRIGNGAGSGTITVGADTSETASRLVQRDSSGGIFGTYIRARKNQTAGNYTTAALWTESYGNTATGVAFHISGNVGKFLEMRTDGILYWNGDTVVHSGNYSSWALPLSGGTISGAIRAPQITAGGSNNTDANLGVQGTSHLTGQIYYGGTVGNVNSWSSTSTSVSGVHTFSASQFIFNRYGYGSQPLIDMQSGSITLSQPTYATNGITVNDAAANGRGINLYSGSPTSPTYGLFFAQTENFGTYGAVSADWATYFTMNSTANRGWIFREVESLGNVAAISNQGKMTLRSHFEQGNNIARPNVSWGAGGNSTGMVIFYLPGTTTNHGMVHMVFDIYEYNGNAVSTVIVGGHNWSTSWYNVAANVIGQCGKEVRLGVKNGRFCVVFGTSGSVWEYGTIVLRKIHNGSFYDNSMDMVGDWESTQTTTESFTNITGDLRALRTPASFNAGGAITQAGNQVLHAGNYNSYAPTLGGTGATGTWNISITGSAGSVAASGITGQTGMWTSAGRPGPYRLYRNDSDDAYNIQTTWSADRSGHWSLRGYSGDTYHAPCYVAYSGYADSAGSAGSVAWSNVSSRPSNIMYYQGFTLDANTMDANSTGFTYAVNAPHTGPIARFSTGGGYDLWLNATYSGGGSLSFRTRNGDAGSNNPWRMILNDSNYNSYSPTLTGGNASGTWDINITGNAGSAYGLAVHGGRNNEANKVVRTDGNGYLQTGYINSSNGDENNASSPARVWGTNGSDSYLRTYQTGSLSVGTATNGRYVYDNGAYSGSAAYREASSMHVYYAYLGRLAYNNGAYSGSGWVEPSDLGVRYAARSQRANGNFYIDDNYGNGIVGVYASTRYQGVFAMGDSYKLPADGTGSGNLYGLAWSYPSAGGVAGNLDSHGLLVLINGGLGSAISYSIVAAGNVTAYSDERLKTNWRPMPENFVERLAQVKSGIYDRIDGEQITQVGIGAQSFQRLLPEAITKAKDEMGTLSVSYGNAAMASAVELAKEIVAIKRELEALKARLH